MNLLLLLLFRLSLASASCKVTGHWTVIKGQTLWMAMMALDINRLEDIADLNPNTDIRDAVTGETYVVPYRTTKSPAFWIEGCPPILYLNSSMAFHINSLTSTSVLTPSTRPADAFNFDTTSLLSKPIWDKRLAAPTAIISRDSLVKSFTTSISTTVIDETMNTALPSSTGMLDATRRTTPTTAKIPSESVLNIHCRREGDQFVGKFYISEEDRNQVAGRFCRQNVPHGRYLSAEGGEILAEYDLLGRYDSLGLKITWIESCKRDKQLITSCYDIMKGIGHCDAGGRAVWGCLGYTFITIAKVWA